MYQCRLLFKEETISVCILCNHEYTTPFDVTLHTVLPDHCGVRSISCL